jgi:hypothetical protein
VTYETDQDRLFAAVLIEGTDQAADAWIASGPEGVVGRLHAELNGEHRVPLPGGVHPRDVIDNLALASRLAGSAYPDEFLAAFPSSEWDGNSFVCSGLGAIRRPEATKRLMRLLGHHDKWVRIAAAAALQGHRHRALRSALLAALDDPEDLVRYHVEERLSELGDR